MLACQLKYFINIAACPAKKCFIGLIIPNDALHASGLPDKARAFLTRSASYDLKSFAEGMINVDDANIYLLVSHTLELTSEQVRLLVEAAIEHAKGREDIIMEYDEQMLWQMIAPILERSRQLSEAGRYIEAVEPVLVIFVLIEKEMAHVEDEGFAVQLLVEDCFKTLTAIAAHPYEMTIAQSLKALCRHYNQERDANYSFCDDEWHDASDALCKL